MQRYIHFAESCTARAGGTRCLSRAGRYEDEKAAVAGSVIGERNARSKEWPGSARALSGGVRRAATFLRKVGIEIKYPPRRGRARDRIMCITVTADREELEPSAPSSSSVQGNASSAAEPEGQEGG